MDYGSHLRKMRMKSGHTQESLAFEMGISTSVVNRIESGKHKLKIELISLIAKAMNKSPENILSELNGVTVHSSIQDNHGNGVKIESIEPVKELYEKLLAEKERYILYLENQLKKLNTD